MGRRGPLPKTRTERKLSGNAAKRTLPAKPDTERAVDSQVEGIPLCPEWLGDGAKDYWNEVVPLIAQSMKLTRLDLPMLAQMCQAQADFEESVRHIKAEGLFIVAKNGAKTKHPAYATMHTSSSRFAKFAAMYGLTPKTRARLESIAAAPPPSVKEARDDFDDFQKQRDNFD